MYIENALKKLQVLLQQRQYSQATDLWTELLLKIYGRPEGLELPNLHECATQSPEALMVLLKRKLDSAMKQKQDEIAISMFECDQPTDEDLDFIEVSAVEIDNFCADYDYQENQLKLSAMDGTDSNSLDVPVLPEKSEEKTTDLPVFMQENAAFSDDLSAASSWADIADSDSDVDDFDHCVTCKISDEHIDIYNDFDGFDVSPTVVSAGNELLRESFVEDQTHDDFFDDDFLSLDQSEIRNELVDISGDESISNEERAYQVAVQVAVEYGLSEDGIDLLCEIFIERGWAQARLAICRALDDSVTIEQLRLAKELKDIWESRADFSIAFCRTRKDKSDYTSQGGRILSWVLACNIVTCFPSGSDITEIEYFLERHFYRWFHAIRTQQESRSFTNYLYNLSKIDGILWDLNIDSFDVIDDGCWTIEDAEECSRRGSLLYSDLVDFGLIPDVRLMLL